MLITVSFKVENKPVKEKIKRELNWYDTIKKEMQVFNGGKLAFEYKEDEYLVKMGEYEKKSRGITSNYRLLPKVEELEVINYNNINRKTNEKEIEKWFSSYSNYNDSNIIVESKNNNEIEFNVPENEVDDFYYAIERQGFNY